MSLKRRTPPVVLPDISEKASKPAILKKDLPDELYPGVPIAGAGSEAPALQAEEAAVQKPPPTPEEEKAKAEKNRVGAIIFRVLYCVSLYFFAAAFYSTILRLSEMEKAGVNPKVLDVQFGLFMFLAPLISTVLLSGFTRLVVGCSAGKDVMKYIGIMAAFNGTVKFVFSGFSGGAIFIPAVAVSAFLAEAILTYDGGGFAKHCKKLLIHIFKK